VSEGSDAERSTEVREHLANERTLLSWVRTGVGLISVGILLTYATARVLLAGDAEAREEEYIAKGLYTRP
jgi:uncharacterized membrane protein YidH (DUF202 family)